MIKRVGIITIIDNDNYGNRLQNYAVQVILNRLGKNPVTLLNDEYSNDKTKFLLRCLRYRHTKKNNGYSSNSARRINFERFNSRICFSRRKTYPFSHGDCDAYVVGSDQVWNPNIARLSDVDLLCFAKGKRKVSISASIGVSDLSEKYALKLKKGLQDFYAISLREKEGEELVERISPGKKPITLIDPTMMLTRDEWDKIAGITYVGKKYVLCYFLGGISGELGQRIKTFLRVNLLEVINLLDKNSKWYESGPSEFISLIRNAEIILTDSFHASVFSLIFEKPFAVYPRSGTKESMNSRIDSLLRKFNARCCAANEKQEIDFFAPDYKQVKQVLSAERIRFSEFLENSLGD